MNRLFKKKDYWQDRGTSGTNQISLWGQVLCHQHHVCCHSHDVTVMTENTWKGLNVFTITCSRLDSVFALGAAGKHTARSAVTHSDISPQHESLITKNTSVISCKVKSGNTFVLVHDEQLMLQLSLLQQCYTLQLTLRVVLKKNLYVIWKTTTTKDRPLKAPHTSQLNRSPNWKKEENKFYILWIPASHWEQKNNFDGVGAFSEKLIPPEKFCKTKENRFITI